MKIKSIKRIFKHLNLKCAGFVLASVFSLTGCLNSLATVQSGISSGDSNGYGSISINKSTSRAVDVSTLTTATVIVSGYDMTDVSVTGISLSGGTGSASIENIPAGSNRVVTVKSNVDGALLRGLVDVVADTDNSVNVNWSTTAVASVYYYLIKNGVDVSNVSEEEFSDAIPCVHASLVDAENIAEDYIAGSLLSSSNYVLDYGTVSVTTTNASGYTIWVTDVSSSKTTVSSDSESFTLFAYPGSWKVYVLDSDGEVKASKSITVVSGETSTVDFVYTAGGGDIDGITIHVPDSLGYSYIYAWTSSGTLAGSWPGTSMGSSSNGYYTYTLDETACSVIFNSGSGSQTTDLYITEGEWNYIGGSSGTTDSDGSYISSNFEEVSTEESFTLTVKNPSDSNDVKIYVSASSAPSIWVWQPSGLACSEAMGYTWTSQPTMDSATDLNYNSYWYVFTIEEDYYTEGEAFSFILNSGSTVTTSKTTTFWYDLYGACGTSGAFYDEDPTEVTEPEVPTVTIKPADGKNVSTNGTITVTLTDGNDTITDASVTVRGSANASYSLSDFSNYVLSLSVSDLGLSEGDSILVSASVTNSVSTVTDSSRLTVTDASTDYFTWDNVNCYFVLTDRFNNGVSANDHSYYRQNADNNSNLSSDYYNVATFHGGDIAGLTAKLDYFDSLGVNAIWITAPYEQAHGWCTGGGNGFPHYAFHGYYTLDWTYMDQSMGTIEEFRTFVNACHSKGIRVVMDVVMNHTGYNTVEDMLTYKFGHYSAITKSHGWCANEGSWTANPDSENDSDYWSNDYWDNTWWGCWIRSFGYSSYATGGDVYSSLAGLPDIRTEMTDSVSIPTFLKTKWASETDSTAVSTSTGNTLGNTYGDYKLPSVSDVDWMSGDNYISSSNVTGDWREDSKGAPSDYQVVWLSGWVREFGIDGFRCDTAKHVDMFRWGQLKDACERALEAWREDDSKDKTYNGSDTGAADWDESFWMTGECFGWTSIAGSGDYYTTGKFDSMINFSFNGSATSSTTSNYPSTSTWSSYLSINSNSDSDSNGNINNVLTYISSHDTALCRASNQYEVGTMLQLTPGGIQIYYGDECSRGQAYTGCGDSDMMTRGDMDFSSNSGCVSHWGKVGTFRKYNPAVGAGTGTTYKRTYSGSAGENSIAISIDSTTVDVSDLYDDGTTVYNWYDGTSATVSGGSVTFSSSSASTSSPVLVSDRNPSDCGISF